VGSAAVTAADAAASLGGAVEFGGVTDALVAAGGEAADAILGTSGELLATAGDVVVGVGTDIAVNGLVGFGSWMVIKKWLLSGGVAAVAVEVVFALATIAIATKAVGGAEEESEQPPTSSTNAFQSNFFEDNDGFEENNSNTFEGMTSNGNDNYSNDNYSYSNEEYQRYSDEDSRGNE
jgi:hypothetical protein